MKIRNLLFVISLATILISCGGNSNNGLTPVELIPISSGSEYGYIDWKGEIVINPQFSEAGLFYDGIALVKTTGEDRRYGYIDTKGNYLIQPEFIAATNFNDGIAIAVKRNEAPKGINKKGKVLFELKEAKNVREFREGLAAFSIENEEGKTSWGFINEKGNIVIEPQFSEVSFFSEGKCAFQDGNRWGFIDTKGKIIINPQFRAVMPFENGKAIVYDGNEKAGVIDSKGKYLINPQFDLMIPDGKNFIILSGNKAGWANAKGEIIINPQFESVHLFGGNKLAPVSSGSQWGYIDKEGKFIINPQFDEAYPFLNGKAVVKNGNYGIIDIKGKYLVNPQFDGVGSSYTQSFIQLFAQLEAVTSDYVDMEEIANAVKKEITLTSLSGLDFSMPISKMTDKFGIENSRYYSTSKVLFNDRKINGFSSLRLVANGDFNRRDGWSSVFDPNAAVDNLVYTIGLKDKAFGKDEDLLREMETTLFDGFEKIANPAEGKVQYKNDNFLITVDSNSSQITLKIIPVSKAVVQTLSTGSEKPIIDPKWVTLPTDKEFRWIKWEDAPEAVKEATKFAIESFSADRLLHDKIQEYLKEKCEVEIAVTDLNENGIYGFALSCSGIYCCGNGAHGCTVQFIEDGGALYSELGHDHAFAITPERNAVSSSANKKFSFIQNNKISSQKQYQLKEYFRYK